MLGRDGPLGEAPLRPLSLALHHTICGLSDWNALRA